MNVTQRRFWRRIAWNIVEIVLFSVIFGVFAVKNGANDPFFVLFAALIVIKFLWTFAGILGYVSLQKSAQEANRRG